MFLFTRPHTFKDARLKANGIIVSGSPDGKLTIQYPSGTLVDVQLPVRADELMDVTWCGSYERKGFAPPYLKLTTKEHEDYYVYRWDDQDNVELTYGAMYGTYYQKGPLRPCSSVWKVQRKLEISCGVKR